MTKVEPAEGRVSIQITFRTQGRSERRCRWAQSRSTMAQT